MVLFIVDGYKNLALGIFYCMYILYHQHNYYYLNPYKLAEEVG